MAERIETRYKVRILTPKALPSGAVQLTAFAEYIEDDGRISVRVTTPGLYCGGIYKVSADEIEKIA